MREAETKTVAAAVAGDRMAFRELVIEYSHDMFRLAWRMTGDKGLAEDVVQEAFIKAWRSLDQFRQDASFKSWMHRITVNAAMDSLRKRSRRAQFETEEKDYELPEYGKDTTTDRQIDIQEQTLRAMKNLSENERAALLLRHYEGHSIAEIAQMLEMTVDACKQTVFRAVKKMRVALQPLVST